MVALRCAQSQLQKNTMPFKANLEGATVEEEQHVIESVRLVKNFPKPGLDFKDLSILLGKPDAFQTVINSLVNRYRTRGVTGELRTQPVVVAHPCLEFRMSACDTFF